MWIVLIVIAALALLITAIWLLPVKVILKNDDENILAIRYRFLFKTYGEDPDPNNPIVKALKKAGGIHRLEKQTLQRNLRTEGLKKTVSESYTMLIDLVKEILALLRYGVVTQLRVFIRCTGDDAAQTAIHYGQCCAVTDALLNVLRNLVKLRKRGCHIDVGCDFHAEEAVFRYDLVLRIRFGRVLAAFWRVAMAEAKRMGEQLKDQPK